VTADEAIRDLLNVSTDIQSVAVVGADGDIVASGPGAVAADLAAAADRLWHAAALRAVALGDSPLDHVVVQDVNPDGRAAGAGLQPGDVIQQVNRQSVQTVEELRTAVRRNADKPALLLISREGRNLFVTVRPNA